MRSNRIAPTAGTCAALVIGFLLLPAGAGAERVVFDLEPSGSDLTISANIFGGLPGFFLSPQTPGADVTSYSGTVTVDVDEKKESGDKSPHSKKRASRNGRQRNAGRPMRNGSSLAAFLPDATF